MVIDVDGQQKIFRKVKLVLYLEMLDGVSIATTRLETLLISSIYSRTSELRKTRSTGRRDRINIW